MGSEYYRRGRNGSEALRKEPPETDHNLDVIAIRDTVYSFADDHQMVVEWSPADALDFDGTYQHIASWLLDWHTGRTLRRIQVDAERRLSIWASAWRYHGKSSRVYGPGEKARRGYVLSLTPNEALLRSTLQLARLDAVSYTDADLEEMP